MSTTEGIYPRSVTPGIKNQPDVNAPPPPGTYIGLDWIRLTGPMALIQSLENLLHRMFKTKPVPNSGARYFQHGLMWEPGVMLSWGHKADICMVDVTGGRLRLLSGDQRIEILRTLYNNGLTPTRIDGAVDYVGQAVALHQSASQSCEAKQLCILRSFEHNNKFTANLTPKKLHLDIGERGSATCGRIYDKGLEQKSAPPGYWERLEIEWKEDRAAEVARMLLDAGEEWKDVLASLVFGAVDFRERNGRSELRRRPRVDWWDDLVSGRDTIRVGSATKEQSFDKWVGWMRVAIGPRLLELAQAGEERVGELCERLLEGVVPGDKGGPIIVGGVRWLRQEL